MGIVANILSVGFILELQSGTSRTEEASRSDSLVETGGYSLRSSSAVSTLKDGERTYTHRVYKDGVCVVHEMSESELHHTVERLRENVARYHPKIALGEGMTISGYYGGETRGLALHGSTDAWTFRRTFGRITCRPTVLLPFPFVYPTWYEKENLAVPKTMEGLVQSVYLSRPATGSFREKIFFEPAWAKY